MYVRTIPVITIIYQLIILQAFNKSNGCAVTTHRINLADWYHICKWEYYCICLDFYHFEFPSGMYNSLLCVQLRILYDYFLS